MADIVVSDVSAEEKINAHRQLVFGDVKNMLATLEPQEGRPRVCAASHQEFLSMHCQLV